MVDLARIESLPLNGRQFANLAATVPGVGLGFNSDFTKSSQYTPQISGGNGRNINYLVDGGDNNDDTIGGLLQLFPLEAIQEFNVMTHRFNAEYGRSNGAVLNVVTKSGTNELRGSWFTLFRDDALNAQDVLGEAEPTSTSRTTGATSSAAASAGRSSRTACTTSAPSSARSRTRRQPVNTLGLFPAADGVYDMPLRETMFTGKVTATLTPAQYLARPLRPRTSTRSRATPALRNAPESWSTSRNTVQLGQRQPQLGPRPVRRSTSSSSSTPTSATTSRPAAPGRRCSSRTASAPGRTRSRRRRRNRRSGSSATT